MSDFDSTADEPQEAKITQGRIFEMWPNFEADSNVTASTIQARVEFRTRPLGGSVIASMATTGHAASGSSPADVSADGTITITQIAADTAAGVWTYQAYCRLSGTFTQGVNPLDFVEPTTGALQQAGWGDLKVWCSTVQSGEPFDCGKFEVLIDGEVTA